jgi:D-threo-aldose 1-dehydrogenase
VQKKTLGRTGINVSIVGLGTAFIGIRAIDPSQSYEALSATMEEDLGVQAVHVALEAGCTLIDTAALYGGRRSERIIGRALRERPELAAGITVTTKVGRTADGYDYSEAAVRRSVEISLQLLGLDRLPVVYIHDPMDAPTEAILGAGGALEGLRRLQVEGILDYIGIAADDPKTNTPYIETGEFDAAVVPEAWSLLNLLAADRILPAAVKHNTGIVVATPLERGLLATGPVAGAAYFNRSYSRECQEHVGKIQALCNRHNLPLVAVALQWCTRHPQVAATIPGARLPQEAVENARAASIPIPESFWAELEPYVQHWEAGVHR